MESCIRMNNKMLAFITIDFPVLLLGLNFILYNAVGIEDYKNIIRVIAFIFLLIGGFIRKKSITLLQLFSVLTIGIELLFQGTFALNILAAFLFAWCTTNNFKELSLRIFKVDLLLIIIVFILLATGLLDFKTYISGVRLRGTLGFINPNAGALFFTSLVYLFILSREDISLWQIILSIIYSSVIYSITDSRTVFISACIFLLAIPLFKFSLFSYAFALFSKSIIIILWVGSAISILFINLFIGFDEILSFRISYFIELMNRADLINYLWGGTNFDNLTVDNFYYTLIFHYGIIFYCFMFYLVNRAINFCIKNRIFVVLDFLLSVCMMGLMESSFIRPELIFALLVWKIIFDPECLKALKTGA